MLLPARPNEPALSTEPVLVAHFDQGDRDFITAAQHDRILHLAGTEGANSPWWSPDSRHIAFFAGGFLAEGFVRFVGMKRGPIVRAMLYGGLAGGFVAGVALEIATFAGSFVGEGEGQVPLSIWLQSVLPYAAIGLGATIAGAYSRVRWF